MRFEVVCVVMKTDNKKADNCFVNDAQRNAAVLGAIGEIIDLYGEAIIEHYKGYTGIDNITGVKFKGLKDIANSAVNPLYQESNINQQAGFAAEVKTVSKRNVEKILSGDKNIRSIRTDNMHMQPDGKGHNIGGVNEQLYDIADVDLDGVYVVGTGRQLKYFGKDAEECCRKILSKKCDKYWNAGVEIEVPSDFYDGVIKQLEDKEKGIQNQLNRLKDNAEKATFEKKKAELGKVRKVKENLRKGELSKEEARFARLYPKLSTLEEVLKLSHDAGIKTIVPAAAIGLAVSMLNNLSAYCQNEKSTKEVIKKIAKDTGIAGATGYGIGFLSSALSGVMKNADNAIIRSAGKTNLPANIIIGVITSCSVVAKYCKGEISSAECFSEIGVHGFEMLASNMFSGFGMTIGGVACSALGGFVGFSIASASYRVLKDSYKELDEARINRKKIEELCNEHKKMLQSYRQELEIYHKKQMQMERALFDSVFDGVKKALDIGDIDGFISSVNQVTIAYGGKPVFNNMQDLEIIMDSDSPIRL